jgi:hypothetical protein
MSEGRSQGPTDQPPRPKWGLVRLFGLAVLLIAGGIAAWILLNDGSKDQAFMFLIAAAGGLAIAVLGRMPRWLK